MEDPLLPLLIAAREGDDQALGRFIDMTNSVIWRICSNLSSGDDVEDLVQDTYLRTIRSLGSFRAESPVLPWVITIARRTCADAVRKRERYRRLIERVRQREDRQPVLSGPEFPIADLLDRLEESRRDAFVLTQLGGLSYAEAASALGCPVGTIRSRVARARGDLIEILSEDDEELKSAAG